MSFVWIPPLGLLSLSLTTNSVCGSLCLFCYVHFWLAAVPPTSWFLWWFRIHVPDATCVCVMFDCSWSHKSVIWYASVFEISLLESYLFLLIDGSKLKHEADGRVILAEFHSFRLLNTYVPNNSWKDDDNGFARRRAWDARMIEFLKRPHKKPLIWCGDLNVRWVFVFSP